MTAPEVVQDPHGWIIDQREASLLFLHWPVPPDELRPLVPHGLELDTVDGTAWVTVSPHVIETARLRDTPPIPHLDSFAEVELRTYVRHSGVPGVWFLSLDAPGHLGNWIRRHTFHLPYHSADLTTTGTDGEVHTTSRRHDETGASLDVRYRPAGPVAPAEPGSLDSFLHERYSMFVVGHDSTLFRGDVEHGPWPLQGVEVEVRENTLADAAGLSRLGPPARASYSAGVQGRYWPLQHLTD